MKLATDNKMHIFFASDNNFALPLTISISSILRNANEDDKHFFHILDKDISAKNKAKIESLKKIKDFEIEYIEVDDKLFENCHLTKECTHISLQTYYRYLIPLIKPDIEKVLYLDCDILIVDSLKPLFEIDLQDTFCGVVEEFYPDSQKDAKRLGLKSFFNAGVLILNNKKLVEENTSQILFDRTKQLYDENNLIWQDQDVLNSVFDNNVTWVSPKYNIQQHNYPDYSYTEYTKDEVEEAKKSPVIIHYNTGLKPWAGSRCAFKFKEYHQEMFKNHYYKQLIILFFLNQIFSIKQIKRTDYKQKCITILGFKIKYKKYKK